MLEFITIPLVVGIITLGIYKLFELFARRRERLALIEKLGEKIDTSLFENKFTFPKFNVNGSKFGTLKVASLLLGVGLGLLVGFFICQYYLVDTGKSEFYNNIWELANVVYGACTLLFGGLGLLVAFILEMKYSKE
jgi:hypothetical protein